MSLQTFCQASRRWIPGLLILTFSLIPSVNVSAQWTRVLEEGPWFPSLAEALLTHDGVLWRVGNGVWRSEDGHTWEQVLYSVVSPHNPPPPGPVMPYEGREAYVATVFNDRMWFVDGARFEGAETERDVWSSADGIDWVQHVATGEAPWPQRTRHVLVMHDDAMWIVGGYIEVDDGDLDLQAWYNDVWRSEDGENWVQVTDNAPWEGRYFHDAFSFQGRLWLIGGFNPSLPHGSLLLREVWSSSDGIDWTLEVADAPWPLQSGYRAVVFEDAIYLLGGSRQSDMWMSLDGVSWTQVMDRSPWGRRLTNHSMTVHDGAIWFSGGRTQQGIRRDVWRYDAPEPGPYGRAHSADQNSDNRITLSELLRVIQFFNSGGYHCNPESEDGYQPGLAEDADDCPPHASDYSEQDWNISLSELLRAIQFFNSDSYFLCPNDATEDGFCAGL